MIGTTEIIIIAVVVLVLFGAAAIPRFAKSLGQAKAEFEKGAKEGKEKAEKKDTKEEISDKKR
jgi:sec-independent protein translocase protein TatA